MRVFSRSLDLRFRLTETVMVWSRASAWGLGLLALRQVAEGGEGTGREGGMVFKPGWWEIGDEGWGMLAGTAVLLHAEK